MPVLKILTVTPRPKPRMSQRDRWKKRSVVLHYFAYRDQVRLLAGGFQLPPNDTRIIFYLPMPKSWSKTKRAAMNGQPHQSKRADLDNLHKGILDAFFVEDAHVWDHRITKLWATEGSIQIETMQNRHREKGGAG